MLRLPGKVMQKMPAIKGNPGNQERTNQIEHKNALLHILAVLQ